MTWNLYTGVAVRRPSGPFTYILVGFTPDRGKHFITEDFKVGSN